MKVWITTHVDGDRAYTSGIDIACSMMKINFPSEVLCRIAGTPAQIATIIEDAAITEQTDEQSETTIHAKHPGSNLENIDIADSEIDAIAKAQGFDPHSRADIQTASRGKQLLQDQENYLLAMISTKKGKSKQFWDDEAAKSGKWAKGIDIENAILDGKGEAHEFVLSRLR